VIEIFIELFISNFLH